MKTVFLISHRSLKSYRFNDLKHLRIDLRLITTPSSLNSLPENERTIFSHIYEFPDPPHPSIPIPANKIQILIQECGIPRKNIALVSSEEWYLDVIQTIQMNLHLDDPLETNIRIFRDKGEMKQKLLTFNMKVPKFFLIDRLKHQHNAKTYFYELKEALNLPFILKPLHLMGSIGVKKIFTEEQFLSLWSFLSHIPYEAEEFIPGPIFHIDALIHNHEIVFIKASRYMDSGYAFIHDYKNHGSIPLFIDNDPHKAIITYASSIIQRLEIKKGSIHLECFSPHPFDFVFLEIALRPPGSLVVRNYENCFGINMMNEDLKLKAGFQESPYLTKKSYGFWCLFPVIPGRVVTLKEPSLHNSYSLDWSIKPGDILLSPQSIMETSGKMLVRGPSLESINQDFETMRSFVALIVE